MKEKLLKVAQSLGLISKIQKKEMTSSDWDSLASAFKEQYGVDLNQAVDEINKAPAVSEERQGIIEALTADLDENGNPVSGGNNGNGHQAGGANGGEGANGDQASSNNGGNGAPNAEGGNGADPNAGAGNGSQPPSAGGGQAIDPVQEILRLRNEVQRLAGQGENSEGAQVRKPSPKKFLVSGPGTNSKYLFGIENNMFARDKRWNEIAATRKLPSTKYSDSQRNQLMTEFNDFGVSLAGRFEELFTSGQFSNLITGNLDYTDLESELGKYYQVRRMDAIIDYLFRLDSLANIFPVRYNVQDEEIITNVFEGKSYSQPYQSGRVFSGGFKFQPDKAKVRDVMFKYKFSDLKDLERQYIGYLNTSGSDPIKWNFVEWIMVMCGTIQINEVEQRRVAGVRVEPTFGKSAHFLYSSDGILTTLDKKKEANQVYIFDEMKVYTSSGILDYVREFVRKVWRLKGSIAFRNMKLYMNELDVPDFLEAYRNKYGANADYNGEKMEVKDFPLPTIVRVPNMGDRKDMWMAPDNAIEIQENAPGEFMAYRFQQDFEELYVMSYKKEGTFLFAGRKFKNQDDLIASKGKHTNIFTNNPVVELDENATKADATNGEMFETVENTEATALTDIENASEGIAYKVVCGNTTNATTVSKENKFSEIKEAYSPSAVGDYLKVIYDPKGDKFIELERKVDGTITVNEDAKAPEHVE